MLYVHDAGRLCNNILQYGHVYAWGREHGRTTMSMRFAYKYQWFRICNTQHHNFLTYLWAKYASKWKLIDKVSFHEPDANYSAEERKMLQTKHLVVEGWYARWYDLFLKYKKEICQLFEFSDQVKNTVLQRIQIAETETNNPIRLGVHIRRGDYKTWMNGKYYFNDLEYVNIIKQFICLFPNHPINIYICNNDPNIDQGLFQEHLKTDNIKVFFPSGNPGEDLCLLSNCHYLIGAPSTFSLVAAMYNDLPLYWIENAKTPLEKESFQKFDFLFRHIK